MTLEEAEKIARTVAHADGGCSVCVGNLINLLNERFPEFEFGYDSDRAPPEPSFDDEDAWDEWDQNGRHEGKVFVRLRVPA